MRGRGKCNEVTTQEETGRGGGLGGPWEHSRVLPLYLGWEEKCGMKNLPTSAVREASPPKMNGFRVLILVCELHVRAPNNCSYSEH